MNNGTENQGHGCPSWCTEPVDHGERDDDEFRFHRRGILDERFALVEVVAFQPWLSRRRLGALREPYVQMQVLADEGLSVDQARHLRDALGQAIAIIEEWK